MHSLYCAIHCIFQIIFCNILNQFCASNFFNSQHQNKTCSHFFLNHHWQNEHVSQIFSKYLHNSSVFFTISFVAIIYLSVITYCFSYITLSSSTSSSFSSSLLNSSYYLSSTSLFISSLLLIFFCFSFSSCFMTLISCILIYLSSQHTLHSIFSSSHSIQTLHSSKYSSNI